MTDEQDKPFRMEKLRKALVAVLEAASDDWDHGSAVFDLGELCENQEGLFDRLYKMCPSAKPELGNGGIRYVAYRGEVAWELAILCAETDDSALMEARAELELARAALVAAEAERDKLREVINAL